MKKSWLILFLIVFLASLLSISIYAQEADSTTDQETELEIGREDVQSTSEQSSSDVDALVEEAKTFDEEFDASAGLLPGSPLGFLDGLSESRAEKVAEMRDLSK